MALGSTTDDFVKSLNLELDKWGTIKIDENHRTSRPEIYAGGELAGAKALLPGLHVLVEMLPIQ